MLAACFFYLFCSVAKVQMENYNIPQTLHFVHVKYEYSLLMAFFSFSLWFLFTVGVSRSLILKYDVLPCMVVIRTFAKKGKFAGALMLYVQRQDVLMTT